MMNRKSLSISAPEPSSCWLVCQECGFHRMFIHLLFLAFLSAGCGGDGPQYPRYENAEYRLHFSYPAEWYVAAEETDVDLEGDLWVSIVALGDAESVTKPILDLVMNPGSGGDVSPSVLLAYADQRLQERVVGSFMVMSSERSTIAGQPAREMAFLYQFALGSNEAVTPITFTESVVFWEKDGNF